MIHLAQTLGITFIVVVGVVAVISIVCYSLLKSDNKLGKSKESPSLKAARENLAIARIHAEQDMIELKRDQIVDARHERAALPAGVEEEIKNPEPLKAVKGEVLRSDFEPRWK